MKTNSTTLYQASDVLFHPMTCGEDSRHNPMVSTKRSGKTIFHCPDCDYVQLVNNVPCTIQLCKSCSTCKYALFGTSEYCRGKKQSGMCILLTELPMPKKPSKYPPPGHYGVPNIHDILVDLSKKILLNLMFHSPQKNSF